MNETTFTTPLPTAPAAEEANRRPRKRELKNLTKREGIWYFHKRVNGKKEFNGRRTPFSLDTRDLVVAKAKRDAILKAANGAEVNRVLGRPDRIAARLGEIFEAYRSAPTVRANATTREKNIDALTNALVLVKGEACEVEKLSSTELTKAFVKAWQVKRLEAAGVAHAENLAALEADKRSINSLLTQMRSLFSAEARDDYTKLYLPPNIQEFMDALPVPARKQDAPTQLPDELVAQLLQDVEELRLEDPAAWTAFQLMVCGGLRNNECVEARLSWLEKVPLGYRLTMKPTETFVPKGNSRAIILPAEIVERVLELLPIGPELENVRWDKHLVPARTTTDRANACYRRLNDWLKSKGVGDEANKIAYRLRKYFLAKINEQQGLLMAQAAAGHSSFRTTQDHYLGKPTMTVPVKFPNS